VVIFVESFSNVCKGFNGFYLIGIDAGSCVTHMSNTFILKSGL